MFAPVPNWRDCRSETTSPTVVYLGWSRAAAMADYITRHVGLEADTSYVVPQAISAPANYGASARIIVSPVAATKDTPHD